jgi:uncharacterized oxidoreductase
MKTTGNTILVTGGSAGIGFAIAQLFSEKGNQVIITGRNKERLERAASALPHVTPIVSDVTKSEDVALLVETLSRDFPSLNIVINNAGLAMIYDLADANSGAFERVQEEMMTNYFSVVGLNERLLPLLKKQETAAIVHVSSIVALVPGRLAGYSASKAALHSYSNTLRAALEETSSIKVFELMPPLVNTEFSSAIGGEKGISPQAVAEELYAAMENDRYEIHVGQTAQLYQLFHSSPAEALKLMLHTGKQTVE